VQRQNLIPGSQAAKRLNLFTNIPQKSPQTQKDIAYRNGMDINFEYYKVFYYAVKCGSLTKAAKAMHSSQPGISRTIRLLEQSLGCILLLRSNRGVSLTPEGELLYAHVCAAVKQLQAAEKKLGRHNF